MSMFDRDRAGGGAAPGSSGGAIYHLSFRSGSRAGGACARASFDYATRSGEYADPDLDAAVYTESGHLPAWAEGDASDFWDAADLFERANGRLFVAADFALPCDLTRDVQIDLAHEFARSLTEEEGLPYTFAIHEGRGPDGEEHNPHVHLMFSERQSDGIERSREEWFRRANPEDPERGGAPKSRTCHGPEWVEAARGRWADLVNEALARQGRDERVDHRSFARQGIESEPGRHYGPAAAYVFERTHAHDRLESASGEASDARRLETVEGEIARLEAARETVVRDGVQDEIPEHQATTSWGSGRDDDASRGR
jgi:hypothetical protein